MSLIDHLTPRQRAELHAVTREHDAWLVLWEADNYIYARIPDHASHVWMTRKASQVA